MKGCDVLTRSWSVQGLTALSDMVDVVLVVLEFE
jgi:hypothetical protein